MTIAATRPTTRPDSRFFHYRQRTPARVFSSMRGTLLPLELPNLDPLGCPETVQVTIGREIKCSLRTEDRALAKRRHAAVHEQVARVFETATAALRGLSHKDCVALAGKVYRAFCDAFENEPGSAERWHRAFALNRLAEHGPWGPGAWLAIGDSSSQRAAAMNARFGAIADAVLLKHGLRVDATSRERLIEALAQQINAAASRLARHAEGDYSSDAHAPTIPKWESKSARQSTRTLTDLFEAWRVHRAIPGRLAPATIKGYEFAFRQLKAFLGYEDVERIGDVEIARYAEHRQAQGADPRTVNEGDLCALKSVFAWSVRHKHLERNPAAGIKLERVSKPVERERGYTDAEALKLLEASLAYQPTERENRETAAAKQWAFPILEYSGARVGEVAQLRKQDFENQGDHWAMRITPEAGRVKTKRMRRVPVHPQLVAWGLIDFVRRAPEGPLFQRRTDTGRGGVINRLRELARSLVGDPRVQPNHGWRHRFITRARRFKIDLECRRMITGHVGQAVDERDYGDPAGLYEEICKLPRCNLAARPR